MRDYGRVHSTFWSSQTITTLSDDGKLLALYLLTCSHSTITGVFRLPDGYVAEDLEWSTERVSKGFAELLANGFANRCETTKWVWLIKHLKWNQPENPNQRKAAAKVAYSIPSECVWKPYFMRVCGPSLGLDPLQEANPSGTVSEPFRNQKQEQEQEQKQEQEKELSPPADAGSGPNGADLLGDHTDAPNGKRFVVPAQKVIDLYHEILPKHARCEKLTDKRRGHIQARWRSDLPSLDAWRNFFEDVSRSLFLTGRVKPIPPRNSPFVADIDWLINENNFVKVLEGKYS